MTLSDYLIEAVAKRTTGKYGQDVNCYSMIEMLNGLGFTKVHLIFGKRDKEYRPDIVESNGLYSRITVHFRNFLYAVSFKDTGELKSIKKTPLNSINIKYTPISFDQFRSEIE